ncbi:pirin family protein [Streptomyces sp. NPDC002838]|uniref:pirin family protein n=1 Tax=Streptomyces sp. NPDC002838 TaxID=3154436 RepID=UPI003318528F
MPAITVEDVLVLPRLPALAPARTRIREVRRLVTAPRGYEGEGFPVRRGFADAPLPELDPFVHFDHLGEVDLGPGEPKGAPWHPHRDFETVTYVIDGIVDHQDSNGGSGRIADGDTQWMTAGAGILHTETPPESLVMSGGVIHGTQLWGNLPRAKKLVPPRYQDIRGSQAALLTTPDGGALIRVIAGDIAGYAGPGVTHTPITLAQLPRQPGPRSLRLRTRTRDPAHPPGGRRQARPGTFHHRSHSTGRGGRRRHPAGEENRQPGPPRPHPVNHRRPRKSACPLSADLPRTEQSSWAVHHLPPRGAPGRHDGRAAALAPTTRTTLHNTECRLTSRRHRAYRTTCQR